MIPHPGRRPHASHPPSHGLRPYPLELTRNLRLETVSRLQPAAPRSLDAARPVSEAVELMRGESAGCLLVTRDGRLVGLFTERDLLTRVLGPGRALTATLAECMTPGPVTVRPKDPIKTAVARMEAGGYRHLPVVDDAGRPVGILSVKRVVRYLAEHFPALVYNQPPAANQYPERAEGA